MILCEALYPLMLPSLHNLTLPSDHEGLHDLFTKGSRVGFAVSFDDPRKTTAIDFFDKEVLQRAFAFDISRFSAAAFESFMSISKEIDENDQIPWALIKVYYSAFYASHAILRMLGQSCTFFQQSHLSRIIAVADAAGSTAGFKIERGVQHVHLKNDASSFDFARAGSTTAGSHEIFWKIFVSKIGQARDGVLSGPLTPAENRIVYDWLNQLTDAMKQDSWLSFIRNDVQYRQSFRVWFPSKVSKKLRTKLTSICSKWRSDPMLLSIDLRADELPRFMQTCTLIVGLCRSLILFTAERSNVGTRCFAAASPLKFLKLKGVA